MARETGGLGPPTRRDYLQYGSAVIGGGLLAGCTGDTGQESTPESTTTATGNTTDTETATESETTTPDGSYSVSIEPVGTVAFDDVPETWLPFTGDYADMGVALGQGDGLAAIGVRRRFGAHLYEDLPDVSVDKSELTELWQDGTDKEIFYSGELFDRHPVADIINGNL